MSAEERWIVISNCQTHGLAHSLQLLGDGITVEPVDVGQYQAHIEHYNARLGDYDRVLIGACARQLPRADLSLAKRVDEVPELVFDAYHPDLTYLMNGADVVNGPIGAYHSMIAFVAHRTGRSVEDTLPLFGLPTYTACGYIGGWTTARDHLVWYCGVLGYDIGHAVRRWGRTGAFMYSTNHPRIHVLYDIARIYLEREGYRPRVSDLLPHDNLANSSAFAIYPEIGDTLGVPGSYYFKHVNEYTQIDLRQFITESFAVYDSHAAGALRPHDPSNTTFERVSAVLGHEMEAA